MNVAASYVYANDEGRPIARVDRIEPGRDGHSKEFLPYLYDTATGKFARKPGHGYGRR